MAFDKLGATKAWVDTWRKNNGVGPNVTPGKDIVPYKWMHPFLNRVKKDKRNDLKIAQSSLDALRLGTTPGLSSKEIRNILKPHTKTDQFGHPTGSLRGV